MKTHCYSTVFLLLLLRHCCYPTSADCNCRSSENLVKTEEHLKLATKISAMKLVSSLRDLLHQTSQERLYVLDTTKYDVIRDLQTAYGKLITHTDFQQHFDWMINEIKRILSEDGIVETHRLRKELTEIVEKMFTRTLPSIFLCLSMGECVTAPTRYVDCMAEHAHKWIVHFGREPEKMIRKLSESISRYKQLEKRLETLQSLLIHTEKTIKADCVGRYANLTLCASCLADRISYCRSSCESVMFDCFTELSSKWDENISDLEHLAKDFSDGFYALERGIHNSLRRLLETSSPHLARDVVDACGALAERSSPTRTSFINNPKPTVVAKKTERLVGQLQKYRGHWRRLSTKFCPDPSTENHCWNGTNIRAILPIEELPAITKNVQPRPMDPRIEQYEGSAVQEEWNDDEDIHEGSGSGNYFEESGSQPAIKNDVFAATTATPATTTTSLTPLIVDSEIMEEPSSSTTVSLVVVVSLILYCWLY